jgi:hypothetical protein
VSDVRCNSASVLERRQAEESFVDFVFFVDFVHFVDFKYCFKGKGDVAADDADKSMAFLTPSASSALIRG